MTNLNVGFPTFFDYDKIIIEVILDMDGLIVKLKEMIRLNIKANFAALGREYGCDYRIAKAKYEEESKIEQGIEVEEKIRSHIIDKYKDTIDNKLETIPGITAYSIYYFLKVEKDYKESYSSIRNYVRENKDKRKKPATLRVVPIIGKTAEVDWKEDFKLINKHGELFIINIFLMRLHYSKKFYARLTIDKKKEMK